MPSERRCLAIVLAAGEGVRMRSSRPKVLHAIAGRTMLEHALASVASAGVAHQVLVIGPGREDVAVAARAVSPAIEVAVQSERLGTAHAVLAARAAIERGFDDILVVFADTPLVRPDTLRRLLEPLASGRAVAVLGFEPENPGGYGRLIQFDGDLAAIREERDASEAERRIGLCNAGFMALDGARALEILKAIGNENAQREFYLTDAVSAARKRGWLCDVVRADAEEVVGVNDRMQLAQAEAIMQRRLRAEVMAGGATLTDASSVYLSWDTKLGPDVVVEPNVFFGLGVSVAEGATVRGFSHLEGAVVGPGASVGPFARLRPGARLAEKVKIGNFVEIKAADIGPFAAISHLSYVGDASVGARANLGAGAITCNYDGLTKSRTEIGADAFIGSNSSLVAPVRIGDRAYVGSGSVITQDVTSDALALGRGRQIEKQGWATAFRNKRNRRAPS